MGKVRAEAQAQRPRDSQAEHEPEPEHDQKQEAEAKSEPIRKRRPVPAPASAPAVDRPPSPHRHESHEAPTAPDSLGSPGAPGNPDGPGSPEGRTRRGVRTTPDLTGDKAGDESGGWWDAAEEWDWDIPEEWRVRDRWEQRRPARTDRTVLPLRVAVIIGSTREGRVGERIAHWFTERASARKDLRLRVVDLIDFDFPAHYPDRATTSMRKFTNLIAEAEAYVVVTPEYNRSYPASLKQAIDFAYDEWQAKPVAFVSYGHGSCGLHAVEHLRSVFTELHTVTLRNGVAINLLDEPLTGRDRSIALMLDQLGWWGTALRAARTARPYVS